MCMQRTPAASGLASDRSHIEEACDEVRQRRRGEAELEQVQHVGAQGVCNVLRACAAAAGGV